MPFHTPFTLGPFVVAPDGRLTHVSSALPATFSFRWRGRLLRAVMQAGDTLTLRAVLGRVPSTASDQVTGRRQSFGLLRALGASTPEGWRVALLPDHRAVLEATMDLPHPVTATGLLTVITGFLLRLGPYLDLVDESGMPAQA
jgi:hypothetical protein